MLGAEFGSLAFDDRTARWLRVVHSQGEFTALHFASSVIVLDPDRSRHVNKSVNCAKSYLVFTLPIT